MILVPSVEQERLPLYPLSHGAYSIDLKDTVGASCSKDPEFPVVKYFDKVQWRCQMQRMRLASEPQLSPFPRWKRLPNWILLQQCNLCSVLLSTSNPK